MTLGSITATAADGIGKESTVSTAWRGVNFNGRREDQTESRGRRRRSEAAAVPTETDAAWVWCCWVGPRGWGGVGWGPRVVSCRIVSYGFLSSSRGRPSSNATPHAAQQRQSRAERATPTHSPLLPCRTNPPPPPPTQLQLHRSIHSSLLRPAARLHPSSPVPAPPPNPSFTCPSRPVCSASPRPARAPFSPPDFRTSDRPRLRLLPARPAGGAPRHCPRRQVLLLSLVWSAGRRLRGRTN